MRDFGPNTSGVDGSPAVINDVSPAIVLEPLALKPDEVVIIRRPDTSSAPPPALVKIAVKKVASPVEAPKTTAAKVVHEG